jgi:hypothetical protein
VVNTFSHQLVLGGALVVLASVPLLLKAIRLALLVCAIAIVVVVTEVDGWHAVAHVIG